MTLRPKLEYETRTPSSQSLSAASELKVRNWFDHTRNVMVVEVVRDIPADNSPMQSALEKKKTGTDSR